VELGSSKWMDGLDHEIAVRCQENSSLKMELEFSCSLLQEMKVDFEAMTEKLVLVPIWVRLLGLPLISWSKEVFKEVRNALRFFYKVDNSFQFTVYMGMAHILVGLNLLNGLANTITLKKGNVVLCQELDYKGISFNVNIVTPTVTWKESTLSLLNARFGFRKDQQQRRLMSNIHRA
jgi:hypothetical protein